MPIKLARYALSIGTVGQKTRLTCLLAARSLSVGVRKAC